MYNCSGLTSITIPNSVTSIGNAAFRGCSGLTSITIPNSVVSIGYDAFYGCSSLTSFTIPNRVTSIGNDAFNGCSGLTFINIPNAITSIGNAAFSGCSGLTSIDIPNAVTSIGNAAFRGCSGLTSIIIPNSVTSIGNAAFSGCSGLTSIIIPNSVTSIGNAAFSGCSGLTSITIPNSVTSIDSNAFNESGWYNAQPSGLLYLDNWLLGYKEIVPTGAIDIKDETKGIANYAFYNCFGLTSITIPNSVVSIGYDAFYGCSSLTSFTIPNRVTSIGNDAFNGCSGLTSIIIPNSVTSIGNAAFSGCSGLTSIIIPNSVTSIGNAAFSGCSGLTSITIPNSVTSIGDYAFSRCSGLADVYCYVETLSSTSSDAFVNTDIGNSTLHVSESTIDEYRITVPWCWFGTIICDLLSNSYKIIYVVDGEEQSVEMVDVEAAITAKEEPTKEGYTFSGWSEIPATMPAHDVIVTGSFTVNTYKLIYIVDGETYKEFEVEFGAMVTPEADLEKEGFSFSGWSDIPVSMPAHDVVVTGSFSKEQYKLLYVVDGETYKMYSKDYQDAITAESAPEREGYTFSGWSEIPETMPAHDVTIMGIFTINKYTITFVVDGEEVASMTQDYQTAAIAPEIPEHEGYTFAWGDLPETVPARDVIVTGSYLVNQYTITYIIDGETYSSVVVDYGSTIVSLEAPEREGCTFAWDEYPDTMPAHDITIEGSYTDGINLVQGAQYVEIYTIDGKKLDGVPNRKGIYIVNGRKVIIK